MDLALNNLQWLICHKTSINQPTNQPTYHNQPTNQPTIHMLTEAPPTTNKSFRQNITPKL